MWPFDCSEARNTGLENTVLPSRSHQTVSQRSALTSVLAFRRLSGTQIPPASDPMGPPGRWLSPMLRDIESCRPHLTDNSTGTLFFGACLLPTLPGRAALPHGIGRLSSETLCWGVEQNALVQQTSSIACLRAAELPNLNIPWTATPKGVAICVHQQQRFPPRRGWPPFL